jgi:predicted ArsR family transcriptional regulator
MSSDNLENFASGPLAGADRFLLLLKTRGPLGSHEIGSVLGITGEAARQQLVKLAADGLVESVAEASGVGRPARIWRLTQAGHRRFPDGHAELTATLLKTMVSELGEEALDRVIAARERETRAVYTRDIGEKEELRDRVDRLAAIRTREGYMASWAEESDGEFLLVENHCPICAAARVCQGFCRSELAVFREALGPEAHVERVEHMMTGARRCAYRITES